jgi:hypothetical protein|tara:strand:+ start:199 stop:495 length:297 start_codon:yes stop_codon:yes gene_type:complete
MGRIEKLKRQSMCEANKQLLGESMIDKEEVKSLVMKRFGENSPTEEDLEDFEKSQIEDLDDIDTKKYADLFGDWKSKGIPNTEEEDSEERDEYPDQTI